ncbi:hypothetical protein ACF1BP_26930 [Streptomyces sp. NPDC014735]|uniref:hypothetical protein n=1 Tax=unclassified Streptomyces TaxID=2593676 RepID=UPI0036F683B3
MEILVDRPLLSLRTTLVFLLAPRGLLAGLAVAGVAVPFFDRLVDAEAGEVRRPRRTGAEAGEGESDG